MAKRWIIIASWMLRVLADDFRPSSGEKIIANQTYLANWLLNPGMGSVKDPIELEIPNMTPPQYTRTFTISFQINPTSTTTTIKVVYNKNNFGRDYILGPFTLIPHETPVTTPTPAPPPPPPPPPSPTIKKSDSSTTVIPTATVTVTSNSATIVSPNSSTLSVETAPSTNPPSRVTALVTASPKPSDKPVLGNAAIAAITIVSLVATVFAAFFGWRTAYPRR